MTNEGETAVVNIQVEIGLLAADGRSVGSVTAWVAASIIQPGERGPFGVLVNEPRGDFSQQTVAVIGGQAVVELGNRTLDSAVQDAALETNGDGVSLSGVVVNGSATAVAQVELTVTFYDAQGNVTGFQQQVVAEELGVAGLRPFRLVIEL